MSAYVLAIDQGTTSTRAMVFDEGYRVVGTSQLEFPQHFPRPGWVEHDPEDIWRTTVDTVRHAIGAAGLAARDIAAIGITNQRETTVVWDRESGRAIHPAIVWQDRRTADQCEALRQDGLERLIGARTGLLIDSYFSATKIAWILEAVDGARDAAAAGRLAFGTIDSFLLWRLTGGRVHATDATNASRTMLVDIHRGAWDEELLEIFRIPRAMLPEVRDSAAPFGSTDPALFGARLPICGIAGDQQAAVVGQACFRPGMTKSTYGTGCFALLNTGEEAITSRNRLLTTIAYRLDGRTTYALEGAIFVAGAAVQWLRDGLGIITSAPETGELARQADPAAEVVLVPAFVGLGAPYWDSSARGAIFGLTRGTTRRELARAALEAVCLQTHDLLGAMRGDWPGHGEAAVLRVDGGMVASDYTMQTLADILDVPVDRPQVTETTALGAAWLAGYGSAVWPDAEGFAKGWRLHDRFLPRMEPATRERKIKVWQASVAAVIAQAGGVDPAPSA